MFGVRSSSSSVFDSSALSLSAEMRSKLQNSAKKSDSEPGGDYLGNNSRSPIYLSSEDQKRSTFLRFCNALNFLTSLAALASLGLHLFFLVLPCNRFIAWKVLMNPSAQSLMNDLPVAIVRLGAVFSATIVVFAEREGSFAAKNFSFVDSWVSRGFFIVFLGALQVLVGVPCDLILHYHANLMVGGAAVSLGLVYTTLGCLCFRQLRNRSIEQIRRRKAVEMQAKALVDQKGEIEALLAETQKKLESV